MAWNKSGAERVKSYRIYQELEARHNEALEEIANLRQALNVKDDLIRRLAAEIANQSRPSPMEASYVPEPETSRTLSGVRPNVRPGSYSSVQDGTSEYDNEVEPLPLPPVDGLTQVKTVTKKSVTKQN